MKYYLAIDIGASSGRHIVGWRENNEICTKEVYRFPNGVREENGHLVWDVEGLFSHIVAGITKAFALDGGQTATIIANDRLINRPTYGTQRMISDIIYFATALPDGE